jgi:hypothetical protein
MCLYMYRSYVVFFYSGRIHKIFLVCLIDDPSLLFE